MQDGPQKPLQERIWYTEYALEPYKRSGTMIPVSSLQNLYTRDDAGYTTYYWFTEEAANEIRAQGNSAGLSRFPVYSRFLVIDIDREDDIPAALKDTNTISDKLREMGLKHSVWMSGGKGYHVYIHCEPMFGVEIPFSHLCWVRGNIVSMGIKVDESLYQHGRLLSNPGRKSKKTGIRKHKIQDFDGKLLVVERVNLPVRAPKPAFVGTKDLVRIALFRAQKALESEPSSRHTTIWSLAGAFAEAGLEETTTIEILDWVNKQWEQPKDREGLERAVRQAYQQTK